MIFLLFIFGLVLGSFLNVVLFRFGTGETMVSGRSRCNACKGLIAWYDNIPLLSFVFLRGKCRQCGAKISLQYPAVELSTALLFAFAGVRFYVPESVNAALETTLALGLIATLVVIFVYDLRHMEIPVSALGFGILWTMFSLFFLWWLALPREAFLDSRFFDGLVGGAIAFSLFYAVVFFSKETWMGEGDAWLALLLGLVVGWKLLLPALTLAFGSGAIVGITLIAMKRKEMQSRIPFGPFLAASVLFILFFGTMVERRFFFGM
jgi:prepilin signal peptidase PulO-like enzyme (type II secretory pathway)